MMRYWLTVVLMIVLGCTRQEGGGPAAAGGNAYEQWVVEQLGAITGPVKLGEWKKQRPADAVTLYGHGKAGVSLDRPWCARAEAVLPLPDGTKAVRYVFFYPPDAPAGFSLPPDGGTAGLLDRACTMGVVWTEREEQEKAKGEQIAQALRAALDRRFGRGRADTKLSFFNAASWRATGRWRAGDAEIASAAERGYDSSKVLAFAFLPVSGLSIDGLGKESREDIDEGRSPVLADVRSLVDEAGIQGAPREALFAALTGADDWHEGKAKKGDAKLSAGKLVKDLKQWLDAAAKLQGRKKAAALLAADLTLEGCQYAYDVADPEQGIAARRELSAIGAEFNESPLGGVTSYTRSWLSAARDLDPDGPIGDRALRMLMRKGFDTSGTCSMGSDQFREVIEEGERYLAGKHDAEAAREVELMVADAYRDIVALAAGAVEDYAQPSDYAAQADDARRKAVQHYRKALAGARADVSTRRAWAEAWRLINEQPPAYLRFYCIYD